METPLRGSDAPLGLQAIKSLPDDGFLPPHGRSDLLGGEVVPPLLLEIVDEPGERAHAVPLVC
jgi:hypothetical protein